MAEEEYIDEGQIELEKLLFRMRTNGYSVNPRIPIVSEEKVQRFLEQKFLEGTIQKFRVTQK